MFRTVIIRNENVLKNSFQKILNKNLVRALSIQCLKKFNQPRSVEWKNKTLGIWKIDSVRQYCSKYPSHTKVNLPALSPTMEQGTIVSWEKKEGDKLNEGDLLAEIETDKATMGFETPEEGYLAKILIPAGSKDVPIGKLVCIIVENKEDVAAFKDYKDTGAPSAPKPAAQAPVAAPAPAAAAPPPPPPPSTPAASPQPHQMTAVEQRGERVYASPMAKKLAETQKLRIEGRGSGLYGSITSKDIGGLSKAGEAKAATHATSPAKATIPKGAAFIDIPVSNIRAVIAKRLLESKITIPHYYVSSEINVDAIIKLREKINKEYEKKGIKLSMNDFIVKALSVACTKVPETNSAWLDKVIRQFDSVDVSVAVSTDKGLITPILFNADRKGLFDISKEVKILANKAREGKLQPHEFQGGTITLSNLGMFGVSHFNAIINPPQSVIVATGATESRMIPDPDNENGWKVSQFMTASVSCDHRVVDGALAAQWLQYFKKFLEDPTNMLL